MQAAAFDVASVHHNTSLTTQSNINFTPGSVTFINLQLRAIIQFAYGISQPSRLAGVPDWANSERFDIVAKGAINNVEGRRRMLQAVLAERFKLVAHTEQRSTAPGNIKLTGIPMSQLAAVLSVKLQAGSQPEDVLVIDRVSHPDEN